MQVCKTVKLRMRDRRNGTKSLFLDFWPGYRDLHVAEEQTFHGAWGKLPTLHKRKQFHQLQILVRSE